MAIGVRGYFGQALIFRFIRLFRGSLPFSLSLFEMKLLRIPLLCKERLGEVESLCYREAMTGSGIEGCEEATSPPLLFGASRRARPLLTKEGETEGPTLRFTHANVGRSNSYFCCPISCFFWTRANSFGLILHLNVNQPKDLTVECLQVHLRSGPQF